MRLGLDIGSTTIKLVLLDGTNIVFETYRRHNADIAGELEKLLSEISEQFPDAKVQGAVTGSGGVSVAHALGLPFVQEVIAETETIKKFNPEADVIIELGGEDAKITYLHPVPEQRMNGTCAGGTGAFIDQMATLLQTDAAGLDELASRHTHIYPIASRCGVFAKSDLQPLINDGAAQEDLAASVFTAVVQQTIAGLACGRPIRGTVVFLGGPLHFLPQLRVAFERHLAHSADAFITPERAQLYVAIGAALLAGGPGVPDHQAEAVKLTTLLERSLSRTKAAETHRLPALFESAADVEAFRARHAAAHVPQTTIDQAEGPCFLGIDAGSTTLKVVLMDDHEEIVYSSYGSNDGNPVQRAVEVLAEIRSLLPEAATIARTCVTGYGESLVQAALKAEDGEVETIAHYRAAQYLVPDVTSIIDIGGQDMKYLTMADGNIDSITVNEACSSGCGSFLQTFAASMDTSIQDFAATALDAHAPVDLGSRCTVFMNSSVKQAQKEGADVGEISAGLSYSVVRNALYKVIKLRDSSQLGEKIVVQGGTFLNDAVLRAFELLTEREVTRPNIAGLMGAFGAARIARERWHDPSATSPELPEVVVATSEDADGCASSSCDCGSSASSCSTTSCGSATSSRELPLIPTITVRTSDDGPSTRPSTRPSTTRSTRPAKAPSSLLSTEELERFSVTTTKDVCRLCQNHCTRTISTFADGSRHVSGNRCDRGAEVDNAKRGKQPKSELPNVFEEKYQRIFGYRRLTDAKATRGEIGIPRALNMYENYPFWFTLLTQLGFKVMISPRSSHEVFEAGMDSISSENICYPAKLVHGHIQKLLDKGIQTIFYPCIAFEQKMIAASDNSFNCPVVMSYPEVINGNMEQLSEHGIKFMFPFFNLADPETLVRRIVEEFADWNVTREEAQAAVDAAYLEDARFKDDVREMGRAALAYMEDHGVGGIVLAGRPYHLDPEINHGIPELVNTLGLAVLTEDSVLDGENLERPLNVRDQWAYHARLYEAAGIVAKNRNDLELVQLTSFGCGLDAITSDQVAAVLEAAGKVYTGLKIDEVSNLGAARIRLRSLTAAAKTRQIRPKPEVVVDRVEFTKEMSDYTILMPQMAPFQFSLLAEALRASGYNFELLPNVSPHAIETGLQRVHNDACYPAIVVIGQLVDAIESGKYDVDKTAVVITQTGGVCRATNYAGLLRKGLKDAGYPQVPVLTLSAGGLEKHSGFKYTPSMLLRLLRAVVLGDLLQNVTLRTRPYERDPGSVMQEYHHWDLVCREFISTGYSRTLGRSLTFAKLCRLIVQAFDAIPLTTLKRKPRVGIVGEILVQYHPDANNNAIRTVEAEGCEAVLPGLMGFILQGMATGDWRAEMLGLTKGRHSKAAAVWALEKYQEPAVRALKAAGGKFDTPTPIRHLAQKASEFVHLGHTAGEGWYLTGEMVHMIENGTPNVICVQPFACLPNHITGKGMFRTLRERYPHANVVGIDYDPGASEVNQLNRIKLMLSTALERSRDAERLEFDEDALPDIRLEMAEARMRK